MTFEIQATPELRKAIENLLMDAEDAPFVLYGKDEYGGMHPIANLTKHPDCPDGWFDEIIVGRWTERKELIDKAVEWLKDMACYYPTIEFDGDTYERVINPNTEKLIKDFKQAMEE